MSAVLASNDEPQFHDGGGPGRTTAIDALAQCALAEGILGSLEEPTAAAVVAYADVIRAALGRYQTDASSAERAEYNRALIRYAALFKRIASPDWQITIDSTPGEPR